MLGSALLLAIIMTSAVAAMLAFALSITLIYSCRFVDIRSFGITVFAAGHHVGTRFPGIASRFVGYDHYMSICSCYYICIYSPSIIG